MLSSSSKEDTLRNAYEAASKLIRECKLNDSNAERLYGKAYQNLVKAGLAQQIKYKYRRL